MDYRDPDWVAEKLGIERNTVYRFMQEGIIPALQLGRKWLVSEEKLSVWLAQETEKQTRARRESAQSAERVMRRLDTFTGDARESLKRAHGEARALGHGALDQLHLLLGLAQDGQSSAGRSLAAMGVGAEDIRKRIEREIARGEGPSARRLGRNPAAKRAMRLAARLATREGGGHPLSPVGTDHLLMGIFLAREGLGHAFLLERKINRQRLKEARAAVETQTSRKKGKKSS